MPGHRLNPAAADAGRLSSAAGGAGECWILGPGAFRALEGETTLGFTREPVWSSLWTRDGLLSWKTTVTGAGMGADHRPGPVEVSDVEGERLAPGRPDRLAFSARRPARWLSGQKLPRSFGGTAKTLACWTNCWSERLDRQFNDDIEEGLFYQFRPRRSGLRGGLHSSGPCHSARPSPSLHMNIRACIWM